MNSSDRIANVDDDAYRDDQPSLFKQQQRKSGLVQSLIESPLKRKSTISSSVAEMPTMSILSSMKSPAKLLKSKNELGSVSKQKDKSQINPPSGQSHNVKVVIRVRPLNEREKALGTQKSCIQVEEFAKITLDRGLDSKSFTFDYVADQDTTQEEIFSKIAQPIADSCLQGYNGTIFAYGQTGSGKTFTIQGPAFLSPNGEEQLISALNSNGPLFDSRGLMQRSFEYIFASIDREVKEAEANGSEVSYLIKTSYLEIYNEQVLDLLSPDSTANLLVREDIKTGVYVEGLIEEPISSVKEMIALITRGSRNRHVGSTSMNKESSRSHSVLTTKIESKTMNKSGVWQMRTSCFHIIDLAGSERSKNTHAEGQRLKEAGMINKSLSTLGIVINSLVEISEGKASFVQYRNSKLTFLLRDSLGGNSKTVIIANITQAAVSQGETLSTLQFAQRAKLIKNKAVKNEESSGTIQILKNEIMRLKQELAEKSNLQLFKVKSESDLEQTICKLCRAESQDKDLSFHDEMLVEKRPDSNQSRIVQLESLLSSSLENLTMSKKYFDDDTDKKALQIKRLQETLETVYKQSQRDKMIIKFRDDRIQKLEQSLAQSGQVTCTQCELGKEQIQQLTKERNEWKEMYEKQTSTIAAKLFAEKEELLKLNQQLTNEIKNTPESLVAQLRSLNNLTDNLNQYLKDYCQQSDKEVQQEGESTQQNLLDEISNLQSQLEDLVIKHELQLNSVSAQHSLVVQQLQEQLDKSIESARHEQAKLKVEAAEQVEQIKSDLLQTLSLNETQFAKQQLDQVQVINELQIKLQEVERELRLMEQKEVQLNLSYVQAQDQISELQKQKQDLDDDYKQKVIKLQHSNQAEQQTQQLKYKQMQNDYNKEIQQLQTTLMLEQSTSDQLRESETNLQYQLSQQVKQNEILQQELLEQQEQLNEQIDEITLQLGISKQKVLDLESQLNQQLECTQSLSQQLKDTEGKLKVEEDLRSQGQCQVIALTERVQAIEQQSILQIEQLQKELSSQQHINNELKEQNVILEQCAQQKQQIITEQLLRKSQSDANNSEIIQQLRSELNNSLTSHNLAVHSLNQQIATLNQQVQEQSNLLETMHNQERLLQEQLQQLDLDKTNQFNLLQSEHQQLQSLHLEQSEFIIKLDSNVKQLQQELQQAQIQKQLMQEQSESTILQLQQQAKQVQQQSNTIIDQLKQDLNLAQQQKQEQQKCQDTKINQLEQQLQQLKTMSDQTIDQLQQELKLAQQSQLQVQKTQDLCINQLQQQLVQVQLQSDSSIDLLQQEIKHSQANCTEKQQEVADLQKAISKLQDQYSSQHKQQQSDMQQLQSFILQQKNEQQLLQSQVQQLQQQLLDSNIKCQTLFNEKSIVQSDLLSLQQKLELSCQSQDQQSRQNQLKLEQIEINVNALEQELQCTNHELDLKQNENNALLQQINMLKSTNAKLVNICKVFMNKLSDLKLKLHGMKQEQYKILEYYCQTVKFVQKQLQKCAHFELTMKSALNLAKEQHTKFVAQQQVQVQSMQSQLLDNTEQLNEYKGLVIQLQAEKQQLHNVSNQMHDQLKEVEAKLTQIYTEHQDEIAQISQDKEVVAQSFAEEVSRLRVQLQDANSDLSKYKAKCADLSLSLKQSKDTVNGLVEKENLLMDELQSKMGELSISQDRWKAKAAEQKQQLTEFKKQYEQLSQKYDLVCQSRDQLANNHDPSIDQLKNEVKNLRLTVQERESEIKGVVKTLKKYSDDKKQLEAEILKLQKSADLSEGQSNLQQKIQYHLKIKEENNKLREENYNLKEEVRKKSQNTQVMVQDDSLKQACMTMVECFDKVLNIMLQLPGTTQFINQTPKLASLLKQVQLQAPSSPQHAAQNFKSKAEIAYEIVMNIGRQMKQSQQKQVQQQLPPTQVQQQKLVPNTTRPNYTPLQPYNDQKPSSRPPQNYMQMQVSSQDNKVNAAAAFLNEIQQRSTSLKK